MLSVIKDEMPCNSCWSTGVVTHWEDGCCEVRETCSDCTGKGYVTPYDLERARQSRLKSQQSHRKAMQAAEKALQESLGEPLDTY